MATVKVTIDSGPIQPTAPCYNYAREKWPDLVRERKRFIQTEITHDCRCISLFVREAEKMYKACGFSSAKEMISQGYELDPDEMKIVKTWLERNDPRKAVPIQRILPDFKLGPKHANRYTSKKKTGGGNDRNYLLARIKRDNPEIAQRYISGEFNSVRQAAIAAGIPIKERPRPRTILKRLLKLWAKATPEERKAFLDEIQEKK